MIKRFLSLMLTLVLMFSLSWSTVLAAPGEEETPRVIHVVYDDSTSMYRYKFVNEYGHLVDMEYYDKWCHARYSLEVFSALMGEKDVMNIYPINRHGQAALTLKGSESPEDRIDRIHRMTDKTGGTPYETVEKAVRAFDTASENVEKWLVILTDGDFTVTDSGGSSANVSEAELNRDLASYAAEGINIAYLAIGDTIRCLPDQNAANDIYVWQAADSGDILRSVTAISNTVFERQQLPDSFVTLKEGTLTISPDVPMEQLVIFAQGDDVSLSGEDAALTQAQSARVSYIDTIPEALWEERDSILVAHDLSGLLTDFRSAVQTPIPAGEYTFSASGIRSVQVYYKPSVSVGILLTQDGAPVDAPVEGEIKAELFLQDPITGERLYSSILKDAVFSGTLTQNGVPVGFTGDSALLDLKPGDAKLDITVELPGYNYVEYTVSFDVQPALGGLTIKAEPAYDDIPIDRLPADAVTYTFFKTDPDTGRLLPLTDEELRTLEFSVERVDEVGKAVTLSHIITDGKAVLRIEHAKDRSGDPDPLSTFTGTLRLRAYGSFKSGEQKGSGETFTDVSLSGADLLTVIGWIIRKWWWLIVAVILIIAALLYYYFAYIRTAKFLQGRKGLSNAPQMTMTSDPGTLRARAVPDPVQTCSVQLDRDYQRRAFCAQRANVIIGCRGIEHFRFTVEAVCENGKHRMKALNLLEQLNQPVYSDVTIDNIPVSQIKPDHLFGYHMRIHYRKIAGRKKEDFDVQL